MKPELERALLDLIEKINSGVSWSLDQLPAAIIEVMEFHLLKQWIALAGSFILIVSLLCFSIYAIRKMKVDKEKDYGMHLFVSGVGGIATLILSATAIINIIKVVFFPKAWLIDYIRSML